MSSRALTIFGLVGLTLGIGVAVLLAAQNGRMTVWMAIMAFAVLGVGLVAIAAAAWRREAAPKLTVAQAAERVGFSFKKKEGSEFRDSFAFLPEIPRTGKVTNVLTGFVDETPVTVFEHMRMIMAGNTPAPVYFSVYATPAADWPEVHITPAHLGTHIARFFGRDGRRPFLSATFHHSFRVRTQDEQFAERLLTPEMQRFLLEKSSGLRWRIGSGCACMVYPGRLKADRIGRSLERLGKFLETAQESLER
ncbi:MAG: hypothetical protein VYC34_10990 [Planctomycetota bacterium]|nr:hypothetical protein [Planctomycetota bacterium]